VCCAFFLLWQRHDTTTTTMMWSEGRGKWGMGYGCDNDTYTDRHSSAQQERERRRRSKSSAFHLIYDTHHASGRCIERPFMFVLFLFPSSFYSRITYVYCLPFCLERTYTHIYTQTYIRTYTPWRCIVLRYLSQTKKEETNTYKINEEGSIKSNCLMMIHMGGMPTRQRK